MNNTELAKVQTLPYHKYLGVEFIEANEGKAEIALEVKNHLLNPAGAFHGGILYTVCEIASYCALLSLLAEGEFGATNHISVQALRAAPEGAKVRFKARVLKRGRRLVFVETDAWMEDKLIAKASITKTLLSTSS